MFRTERAQRQRWLSERDGLDDIAGHTCPQQGDLPGSLTYGRRINTRIRQPSPQPHTHNLTRASGWGNTRVATPGCPCSRSAPDDRPHTFPTQLVCPPAPHNPGDQQPCAITGSVSVSALRYVPRCLLVPDLVLPSVRRGLVPYPPRRPHHTRVVRRTGRMSANCSITVPATPRITQLGVLLA